jgi:MATE family multidrug resistance protein
MRSIVRYFKHRWGSESGYREVLVLAFPLIISTGSWSIQHFIDRMFLTWYSPESIAAAMPAGILNFSLMSIFIGTASYVSTFSAQYTGAGRPDRIGSVLWQGIYISFIAGIVLAGFYPFSGDIFHLIGHEPAVVEQEIVYFKILCLGAMPAVASAAFSGFFTGMGRTSVVMWITVASTAFNLIFDYMMIFGKFIFPEMGISGAAAATVMSQFFALILYIIIASLPYYSRTCNSLKEWRFNPALFNRLIKFGLPSGIQFFIETAGFTFFLLFIGRLGTESLAATNIAFNINTLAFMPMIGLGIAVSIIVGQHLGAGRPEKSIFGVYSGLHITLLYMGSIAALYLFFPRLFTMPFEYNSDPAEFAEIKKLVLVLLRFIAFYSIFDAFNIIFANALRGAGDTRFVMFMIIVVTIGGLLIPSYLFLFVLNAGIYTAWTIATIYVSLLGIAFFARFLRGKWKNMRVIEETVIVMPQGMPENPVSGI